MSKDVDAKIRRVLDANFNRVKEGLRVCEDVCRFVYDDRRLARVFKETRHTVTALMGRFSRSRMIDSRDVAGDVGRGSTPSEMARRNVEDILFANLQRAKESIRVLEEFAKLSSKSAALGFKQARYRLYRAEQALMRKF
jgi:thiamine-phosphate pyrophosphorylase